MSGSLIAAGLILLAGLAIVGFSVYQKTVIAQTEAARDVAIHGQDVSLSIAHETKQSGASAILSGIGNIVKGVTGPLAAVL
jgi:hypothetical protein